MLQNTFCHLPGVGSKTERDLWDAGLTSWQAVLDRGAAGLRRPSLDHLQESVRQFGAGNPAYFSTRLPAGQQWRLFADFRDRCAYVDIETTGMARGFDQITAICLYDGRTIRTYVQGDNLEEFRKDLSSYRVLITYNGKCFDVPFLERGLDMVIDQAHIDLRYVLRDLGLRGGLKSCERQVGLARPGLEEVDGFMAVRLWYEFKKRKNRRALETLLAYNVQDAVNLETLMVLAYNRHLQQTPFAGSHGLAQPSSPPNPFQADEGLVRHFAQTGLWSNPYRGTM